ncbi:MAG: carcinine hydrolase/isopenicillin-N N-acyltransferase family protein [Gammaproteobacteria bacterium]|nr:carcinine hydrolase/isopenicillin-N N-acyltransferase family protein [Gammaproteobacteria bacterium]
MCDTFVVVKPGRVLFGKNSDRDPNEAQALSWVPARDQASGSELSCTWRSIPQVEHTHAVFLSRPFWMWGAEMGANEHGVVIGNEAIFTKESKLGDGLLGMDLVRLGLERGVSAAESADVICELIETFGQGGRCSYEDTGLSYHNSFLIADHREAWVVEAAGKRIARKRIDEGVYAISNDVTLPEFRSIRDRIRPWVARAHLRQERVRCLAANVDSVKDAMAVLRDHGSENALPRYSRHTGAMSSPCMHAGGWLVGSQTTGSMVSELQPTGTTHWATGTSAPCQSVFRPVSVDCPRDVGSPTGTPGDSLWWRFEQIHRSLLGAESARREEYLADRDEVQAQILGHPATDGWHIAEEWLYRQEQPSDTITGRDVRPRFLRRYWQRIESQADVSLLPWREA